MKAEIELSDEIADIVIRNELRWHLQNTKKDLMNLRGRRNLLPYQREDKEYFEKLYPALKTVCEYFGVDENVKK